MLSQGETRACCWLSPPIPNNKLELNLPGAMRNYIRRESECERESEQSIRVHAFLSFSHTQRLHRKRLFKRVSDCGRVFFSLCVRGGLHK
jgi:hypothetical protein